VQDDIAGYLEGKVAEKEDSGADSVDAVAEFEVAEHLQLGEAYVDAVDVGDDVADHEDGHDAPGDLAIERVAGAIGGDVWRDVSCG